LCLVGKSADVHGDQRVADGRVGLSYSDEPVTDAALVEHLERTRVQPSCAGAVQLLRGSGLDDDDVDSRERQLPGQHEPGRAASCDHYGVLAQASQPFVGQDSSPEFVKVRRKNARLPCMPVHRQQPSRARTDAGSTLVRRLAAKLLVNQRLPRHRLCDGHYAARTPPCRKPPTRRYPGSDGATVNGCTSGRRPPPATTTAPGPSVTSSNRSSARARPAA